MYEIGTRVVVIKTDEFSDAFGVKIGDKGTVVLRSDELQRYSVEFDREDISSYVNMVPEQLTKVLGKLQWTKDKNYKSPHGVVRNVYYTYFAGFNLEVLEGKDWFRGKVFLSHEAHYTSVSKTLSETEDKLLGILTSVYHKLGKELHSANTIRKLESVRMRYRPQGSDGFENQGDV